jgi:hypothetical protein
MAGGQQSDFGQGSFGNNNNSVRLRSKKSGGGSASAELGGQQVSVSAGTLGRTRSKALTGSSSTLSGGTVTPSGGGVSRIVDEISGPDTALRDHPDIIWYPRMDTKANAQADWTYQDPAYPDYGTISSEIVQWSQCNIPAIRVRSQKVGEVLVGNGVEMMDWKMSVNSNTNIYGSTGGPTGIGNTVEKELYFRFAYMFEDMTGWGDDNENAAGKLSTIASHPSQGVALNYLFYPPDHPTVPLRLGTYYWQLFGVPVLAGNDHFDSGEPALIPYVLHVPGVIYSIETHLKINTQTGATFNSDGRIRAWISSSDGEYDDVLFIDLPDRKIITSGDSPIEINYLHGQLYLGGQAGPPENYCYIQTSGFAVARRRIGPLKLIDALPYTLPDAGESVQIATNTPEDTTPPSYSYFDWHGANFGAYGAGDFNADYSTHGAYCIGASGGEGTGNQSNFGILAFNFTTGEWEGRSLAVGGYDYYGDYYMGEQGPQETTGYPLFEALTIPGPGPGSSGIPVPGHAYHNNIILPASLGGGPMGSMITATRSACCVESKFSPAYHRLDIDTMTFTHLGTGANVGSGTGNMANGSSVLDAGRGRILHRNGSDGRTAIEYLDLNDLGGTPIKAITPGPGSFPVGMEVGGLFMYEGYVIMMGVNSAYTTAKLYLLDQNSPESSNGGWLQLNYTGDSDALGQRAACVWQWVPRKGMFYKLPITGGTTLWTLTPPPLATIKTGVWTTGTKSFAPSVPATGNAGTGSDAWWHAFWYHELLDCFVWIPARDNADGTVYLIGVPD